MNKHFIVFLFVCISAVWSCSEDDEVTPVGNWTQISPIEGVARSAAVSFVISSRAYVGTEYDGDGRLSDFWEFDQQNQTWRQIADFGSTARNNAVGFAIGNKGYVGTGYDDTYKKDFWEYDPATNRWAQKADFGGAARQMAVGFSVQSLGFIGTGYTGNYVSDFWKFDPSDASLGFDIYGNPLGKWTQVTSLGGKNPKRRGAVSFVIDNQAYVGSGESNGTNQEDFFAYNTETNLWTEIAAMEDYPRSYGAAFALDGKGYVGIGARGSGVLDFLEYDPATNEWETKTSFEGAARTFPVGFAIGNKGYIGTGASGNFRFDDFWEFSPAVPYDEED